VLDNELNLLPIGVAGELYIGGEIGLARGYHQRPDLTAERFLPDPFGESGQRMYRTGDLVRWREDGALDYLGRVDHQVKIRGFRIELGEIESQLLALPQVAEAAVVARDTPSGKQLVGYLVGRGELDLSAIKEQLAALLPDYMLPAQLMQLDNLPLTPARKLDRAALPEPQWQSADYQAPQGSNEQTLAAIWQQVLGVERVGRSDHFFELGGDSIVALQVVSRARQQGLALAPRDLFQQQTLAELAAVARPASESTQAQGPVSGEVPLTPIQAHFFAMGQAEPAHWNQSLYLEVQRPLDPALLELTLQALVLHHDALRLRFAGGHQWYAAHDALNTPLLLSREVDSNTEAEELCNQVQRSLDLAAGPLLRALYLRQTGQTDRLLLVIHHLVVDGVSWRMLLEDLPRTYERLAAGQPPALPAKTCSYRDWAEHLQRWARSEQAAAELDNWCTRLSGHDQPLPQDLPAVTATFGEKREVRIGLDRASSKRLLTQVPSALGVRINDLLLTALTRALCAWSGQGALRVNLEGHGREPLAAGLDPSRTLGWFTSLYPLRLPHVGDLREQLHSVQTQLQHVANGGVGYGALRWLGEPATQAALAALPPAQVTFNYLGQYTGGEATGWFRPLAGGGAQQAANNPLGSLLTVNGQVFDGELSLAWEYAPSQLHESTVQGLAEAYRAELLALLDLAGTAAGAGPAALLQLSRQTPPAAPLFCPHPVTGRVTGYQPLTAKLEGQRAVFGLQCRSFADPEWRDASLAEMADAYLAALLRQQPTGPYHLLGWSLGGSLALELAARLEARGQTVAFLGLVDCYVPGTEIPEDDSRHPHARARLGEHLRLLVPELSTWALDDLLARLEPLPPLDWSQACKQWLLGQGLDAVASESLQELLFAWSVEQQMRRLCTGYALPSVKARPHCWWASRPEGRAAVLEQGLEQALGRAASHSLIDADHLGIVRSLQTLEQVSRYLAALS
jgi:non-ribosomal peptide synthase protein (TIGR01720 family)